MPATLEQNTGNIQPKDHDGLLLLIADRKDNELAVLITEMCIHANRTCKTVSAKGWGNLQPGIHVLNNKITTSIGTGRKGRTLTGKDKIVILNFPVAAKRNDYQETEKVAFEYGFFELTPARVLNRFSVRNKNHVMDQAAVVASVTKDLKTLQAPQIKTDFANKDKDYQPWPEYGHKERTKSKLLHWKADNPTDALLLLYLEGKTAFFDLANNWRPVKLNKGMLKDESRLLSERLASPYYEALVVKDGDKLLLLYIDSSFQYIYDVILYGHGKEIKLLFHKFILGKEL